MNGDMVHIPRLEPLSPTRSQTIAVLDVGTAKITCLIAKLRPLQPQGNEGAVRRNRTHSIEVLGFGMHRSAGIQRGLVVDLEEAERAICSAVESAERMAGVTVEGVIAGTAAGRMSSDAFEASIRIGGPSVSEYDVSRVISACHEQSVDADRTPLHVVPTGFAIDEQGPVRDPSNMVGETLGAHVHVVSAQSSALRNLLLSIEKAHLGIDTLVATPYASGLAVLVPDEMEMGAVVLDMGAGTTTVSVFHEGRFQFADAIAIGGQHVTLDLARGLGTALESAERIKTLFGSAISTVGDHRDLLTIPPVEGREGHDVPAQVPRAFVTDIIQARIEEILEVMRDRLATNGFAGLAGQKVVITGGASQLAGVAELTEKIMQGRVRIGRPFGVTGLPEAAHGPSFAAVVGLMVYPQVATEEDHRSLAARLRLTGSDGYFARVGRWIVDSF